MITLHSKLITCIVCSSHQQVFPLNFRSLASSFILFIFCTSWCGAYVALITSEDDDDMLYCLQHSSNLTVTTYSTSKDTPGLVQMGSGHPPTTPSYLTLVSFDQDFMSSSAFFLFFIYLFFIDHRMICNLAKRLCFVGLQDSQPSSHFRLPLLPLLAGSHPEAAATTSTTTQGSTRRWKHKLSTHKVP